MPQNVPGPRTDSVGVLGRAGMILRVLAAAPGGTSLARIAGQIDVPRSTVQRLVAGLEAEGLVETGAGGGQIRLGAQFLRLAELSRPRVLDRIHPLMVELAGATGETVDLSMIRGRALFFVDQVVGTERLLAVSHIGDLFPLHCTSVGKAYLAALPADAVLLLIGTHYPRHTPHTLVTHAELAPALAQIRVTGISVDLQEQVCGIAALGVAFQDSAGAWFGVSVPLPMQRFEDKRLLVVRRLLALKQHMRHR